MPLISSKETKKKYWKEKNYRKKTKKHIQLIDRLKAEAKRGLRYWNSSKVGTALSDGKGWHIPAG